MYPECVFIPNKMNHCSFQDERDPVWATRCCPLGMALGLGLSPGLCCWNTALCSNSQISLVGKSLCVRPSIASIPDTTATPLAYS